ncbi:aminotransferase-like domain-containing protein [Herbaspirillum camelliae]|uniref:aminotransferase-like domain-containing protein n=1 Tax=Herbaspirillum camelliae TaxID=1892903 RepID=UPI00094A0FA8|nr:PLP-dependent aminotransferase family protein [Herbaspirillum camelliae]
MVQIRNWRLLLDLAHAGAAISYRDIVAGLVRAIGDGRLPPGAALPGTREMAAMLRVNRKTVIVAYEEAAIKGWLVSRERSGTFVSTAFDRATVHTSISAVALEERLFAPAFQKLSLPGYFDELPPQGAMRDRRMMYFDNGSPDHRLLPQAILHRHYRRALREGLRNGRVRYGNLESASQLREALADMLSATRALPVAPSNICLTQGTQMALHLAAAALIQPGDTVVVERLSYPPAWAIFRALGARVEVVDIDAHGCKVEQIDALCRRNPIRFIYLTPHHQFPSTVSLRADRREKLLALAIRHGFSVIEEDYDHEYHFTGRPHAPLASDPWQRHVIYVGSLSKLLGPSFRCGFVVGPENLVTTLESNQRLLVTHGDAILQKMLAELIVNGELRRHVKRSSKHYRQRLEVLLDCLRRSFGDRISTQVPEGGLALWVTFTDDMNVDALASRSISEGLFVRSGSQFSPLGESINGLRLGFASMSPDELVRAVARLQRASDKL